MFCVNGTPGPACCAEPVDMRIFRTLLGDIGAPFFALARP